MAKSDTSSAEQDASPALIRYIQQNDSLRSALSQGGGVELRAADAGRLAVPLMPGIVSAQVDPSDFAAVLKCVDGLEIGLQCVVLRDILNRIEDYRTLLARAFEKVGVQGHLVIVVPHQFLYERKLQPPSRLSSKHIKFYTPALLLAEIEESIDPFQYRLRSMSDNDLGYDYGVPLPQPPVGGHDIVVCLQKIAVPSWRDRVEEIDRPARPASKPSRFLPPGREAPYYVVSAQKKPARNIIVLKLDHRGDFILAEDAFRVIRSSFPNARITLCCGIWNVDTAQKLGTFDEILPFNFFPEDISAVAEQTPAVDLHDRFRALLSGKEYDLAADLRLFEDTRPLLRLVNAKTRAGFDPYDMFPWIDIRLNIASSAHEGRPEQGLVAAAEFEALGGHAIHRGYDIVVGNGSKPVPDQPVVWGAYRRLAPGHYTFEVILEPIWKKGGSLPGRWMRPMLGRLVRGFRASAAHVPVRPELAYELCCDSGNRILERGRIDLRKNDPASRIFLQLLAAADGFELRLRPSGGSTPLPFRFLGVRYTRYGALIGVHQSEAMALLAHLIALRMRYPLQIERHAG